MTVYGRIERWLGDLLAILDDSDELTARGRGAYDVDTALPLAFEAVLNRVGDLAKKLLAADPGRFADERWRLAARTRDFVVHQYHRIDANTLWTTVNDGLPELRKLAEAVRTHPGA